ncbi:MAG TPA: thioredoxin-disulfide reductase [Patescibacteria group bacterium]
MPETRNLIILGSGPAGLTAGLYAARADLKPLILGGSKPYGQLMLTTDVENYPGFPEGIQGPELMDKFSKQAVKFGAEIILEDVMEVNFKKSPFTVKTASNSYLSKAVIVATGADTNWLGLESEQRLIGRGVSSCAPCDAYFFRDKKVIVVGGGDSAMEEALTLSKFATKVTVIHRREEFRASKIMLDRAKNNSKINFLTNTVVEEVLGKDKVEGVNLKNVVTGKIEKFGCDGVFVAIGHSPNTIIFENQLDLDEKRYLKVKGHTLTNIEGVFAAGDVHDHHYRQAITAAAFGCMAAMDSEKWLESR